MTVKRTLWALFLVTLPGLALGQSDGVTIRLPSLQARFDEALQQIEGGYQSLNDSYTKALVRAMEAESGAGKLENALAFKAEIEAFKAQAIFDKAAFEKRISSNPALSRLQNTYLTQRNTLGREIDPRRKELLNQFDAGLGKLQTELTKVGQLNSALDARKVQEALRADPRFASLFGVSGAAASAIHGKIRFVTKGELELYLNGKSLSYRNSYDGSDTGDRITGETKGSEVFHADDLLVVRSRSSASFRGVILAVIADDGAACIPIRVEHLRYLGVGKDPSALTLEMVKSTAPGGVGQGGNDPQMTPEWDKVNLPAPAGEGSHWFRSETGNEWHGWGIILTPAMIVSRAEK